jgi:hypothetical protein
MHARTILRTYSWKTKKNKQQQQDGMKGTQIYWWARIFLLFTIDARFILLIYRKEREKGEMFMERQARTSRQTAEYNKVWIEIFYKKKKFQKK